MSQDNVKSFEKEAFKKKLEKLSAQPEVGEAEFADAVYTAVSSFGLAEVEFRDTFGLSKGAVERWTMRKNMPQPGVRPKVLRWILQKI
jgi:hypothetical protein